MKNGINYDQTMKTAISLDGTLLQQADQAARAMGLSRSRLFCVALEAYLRSREQEKMIEQLNQVYSEPTDPVKRRITKVMKAKFRPTITDRW
jgi:metal-responsive CopG/Arc/MetJ family transcriptional regulator